MHMRYLLKTFLSQMAVEVSSAQHTIPIEEQFIKSAAKTVVLADSMLEMSAMTRAI